MPSYLHPGVYVEEIPSGSKPIEGVGTSTAAFVGYAVKGPIGEPTLIHKWDDYAAQFGGVHDLGSDSDDMGLSVSAFFQNGGTAAYIVRITKDWNDDTKIDAVKAEGCMDHPAPSNLTDGLVVTAVDEGDWANDLIMKSEADPNDAGLYTISIGRLDSNGKFVASEVFSKVGVDKSKPAEYIVNVINKGSSLVTVKDDLLSNIKKPEYFLGSSTSGDIEVAADGLDLSGASGDALKIELALDGKAAFTISLDAADYRSALSALAANIQSKVREGSNLPARRSGFTCQVAEGGKNLVLTSGTRLPASSVVVTKSGLAVTLDLGSVETSGADAANAAMAKQATLVGGSNGSKPGQPDYQEVFGKFLKYRDINIICLPGQSWSTSGNSIIGDAIGHAEKMHNRMVIVDPSADSVLTSQKSVNDLGLPSSTYSVLYYPWVKVANPLYNSESDPVSKRTVTVAPSGFAAGMWAKIDGKRGVWKAPAGLESGLLGVSALEQIVEDDEQNSLNPLGVNCLRRMPGAGPVIWGARTLATKADPEWRYVPVRRTAMMIEQSIYDGIQWAVFEPNKHTLWSALRTNIGGFMNGLFRAGAFQGEKASDAYFVRCGLGDTMTQADIDAGQVIVIVGFAPVKPAEFVIVRIQQKVNQQ